MDFFLILFLNFLLEYLSQPKFPKPRQYALSEFSFPTATEDRATPVLWGTVPVAGNVIFYGDFRQVDKYKRIRTGLFTHADQPLGSEFYVCMHMSLCARPADALIGIQHGDKMVWTGNQPLSKVGPTDVVVNGRYRLDHNQELDDGIAGTFRFYNRKMSDSMLTVTPQGVQYTPADTSYLASQMGVPVAGDYPGTCHVLMIGPSGINGSGYVGYTNQIQPVRFILKRLADIEGILHESVIYNPWVNGLDAVADINGDANPALIIAEILCSQQSGMGPRLSPNVLDAQSFINAAHRCYDEKLGMSFSWDNSKNINDLLGEILQTINGFLLVNPRSGRLTLKLLRDVDTDVDPDFDVIPEFDASSIIKIDSFVRTAMTEAPNEIVVPFVDKSMNYQTRNVRAQNLAAIEQVGAIVSQQKAFLGIANADTAAYIATRELRAFSTSLANVKFTGRLPAGKVLRPGDKFVFTHPHLNQTLQMRVVSASWADYSKRREVQIEGIEDVFRPGGYGLAVSVPDVPAVGGSGAPQGVKLATAIRAPYALTGDDTDHAMYYAECDDVNTAYVQVAVQEGRTSWVDGADDTSWIDGTVMPSVAGSVATTVYASTQNPTLSLTLSAGAAAVFAARPAQASYMVSVAGELLVASNATLAGATLTLSGIKRAVFDTVPVHIAVGAHATVILGYAIDPHALTQPAAFRAEARGSGGVLTADQATASATSIQAVGPSRAIQPVAPAAFKLSGVPAAIGDLDTVPVVTRPAGDTQNVTLTFVNRSRLNRNPEDYFSATNNCEDGQTCSIAAFWERTPGSGDFVPIDSTSEWSLGAIRSASGSSLTFNVKNAPAANENGGTRIKVVASASCVAGGQTLTSVEQVFYWRLSE